MFFLTMNESLVMFHDFHYGTVDGSENPNQPTWDGAKTL